MSYCLIKNIMVAYVRNGQLVCAKVKVKLSGDDSVVLYNTMHRIHHDTCGRILLEQESDRDFLPTILYRERAEVIEGHGGALKRIEQFAKSVGLDCRVVDLFKDSVLSIGFLFYLNQPNAVVCQIIETDKEELAGKTLFIGADPDVDYVGANVVPMLVDENFDVDDKLLGNKIYSLNDDQNKMLVSVGK